MGEPKLPKRVADTFKKQCGVLVRDHVEWNKRKGADDSEYVSERYKESLWNDIDEGMTNGPRYLPT
jgi:hypothetical protein